MKTIYLLSIMLSFAISSIAQNQNTHKYLFTHYSSNYANLSNATSLNNGNAWDEEYFTIPFSFPFKVFGKDIPQLYFVNGWLGADTNSNSNSIQLNLFGTDLCDRGVFAANSLSPASYKVEGAAGNRVLKFELKNAGFYEEIESDSISGDFVNLQYWFYEQGNIIEVHLGSSSVSNPSESYLSGTGASFYLLDNYVVNRPGNNLYEPGVYLSGAATSPTSNVSLTAHLTEITGTPPNGKVYRFAPNDSLLMALDSTLVLNISERKLQSQSTAVFPNPAVDELNFKNQNIDEYEVYDVRGALISAGTLYTPHRIDISHLLMGTYFLRLKSKDSIYHSKFVKR